MKKGFTVKIVSAEHAAQVYIILEKLKVPMGQTASFRKKPAKDIRYIYVCPDTGTDWDFIRNSHPTYPFKTLDDLYAMKVEPERINSTSYEIVNLASQRVFKVFSTLVQAELHIVEKLKHGRYQINKIYTVEVDDEI